MGFNLGLGLGTCIHKQCMIKYRPLYSDVTFGHFRIRPFGRRHVGGQKCIAVIEKKALIVSLFTNTSDYSSETTINYL